MNRQHLLSVTRLSAHADCSRAPPHPADVSSLRAAAKNRLLTVVASQLIPQTGD